jgi:hypothetical protein
VQWGRDKFKSFAAKDTAKERYHKFKISQTIRGFRKTWNSSPQLKDFFVP